MYVRMCIIQKLISVFFVFYFFNVSMNHSNIERHSYTKVIDDKEMIEYYNDINVFLIVVNDNN